MAVKVNTSTPVPAAAPRKMLLELSLYSNYSWRGERYEKGKAYSFPQDIALQLLAEQDCDRPIWKQFVAPQPKPQPKTEIVEVVVAQPVPLNDGVDPAVNPSETSKRISVGDDSEIADLLPSNDENVTV